MIVLNGTDSLTVAARLELARYRTATARDSVSYIASNAASNSIPSHKF
jgi:hypothetical protein